MRIHIIANKNWEVEPLINAFLTRKIYQNIGLPENIYFPTREKSLLMSPRVEFLTCNGHSVKISCVQDYIKISAKEKSSEYKFMEALPILFAGENSDLIICFGTAGYPQDISINGSVMMGHLFFIHYGRTDNPESKLVLPEAQEVIGNINDNIKSLYNVVSPDKNKIPITAYMQAIPENPRTNPTIVATSTNVAISVINITDYDEYIWADREGLEEFTSKDKKRRAASIETTHGLIGVQSMRRGIPCMWVSAITDREGFFDMEVHPIQNYFCSYNGGLALAKMIDLL